MANTTNWLNISATSGSSGETILTLSANKNLSLYDKRAEITAYNPVYNISAKTYVTIQSFAPIIELSPAIIGVPDTGGTYELNISANCAWVISFPDLVSSYSTSAGTGNATVTLTVPGTSADTTLVGNIVVTAEGGQMSKTARIEQYGQGVQLSVSHSEILFPDSGAVRYFTVTANCVYDVSVVSGDWAVVSPQSGYTGVSSFTVTVDGTNTGTTTREGIVRISAPGVTRYIMLYQNPKETRLTAYYNATSTTNPTELYEVGTGFSKAETPDGTVIPGDSYIFPDTGSNRVFYTMTGTSIPANTFSGMSALTSVVIPDNITTIGEGAFRDCVNLTSVTIPDTVTVLPDNCFNGCSSLTAIPISDSVTYIGEGCFAGCTGIETVTIPTGVTGIGAGCFSGSGVETIYANSPTPATIGNGAFTSGNLQDIIVPCAFFDAYKTAWSAYEEYMSCQDDQDLYFVTDTNNVKGTGETRTITILNTNIIQNRIGLTLPSDFPPQGAYVVDGNVIYLTYPANPSSTSTRTWTITVRATTTGGKDLSGSYRITQNANVVYSIPYTADTSTVAATGETRTITIDTSNLDPSTISIGIEGATGVSYTYDNGVITIVFPENGGTGTGGTRNITVNISAVTNNGQEASATIGYSQDYIYTGETRVFAIYRQRYASSDVRICGTGYTKVELEDGTDITSGMQRDYDLPDMRTYNFGGPGFYGVYITIPSHPGATYGDYSIPAYFLNQISAIVIDVPNNFEYIAGETFANSRITSLCLGEGVTTFGRGVFMGTSIDTLTFRGQNYPAIASGITETYQHIFQNAQIGKLKYPCGADYTTIKNAISPTPITECFPPSGNCDCLAMGGLLDTRYTGVFNVTSTTEPTVICGDNGLDSAYPLFRIELQDGTPILYSSAGQVTYTFSATGLQTVYYYPLNDSNPTPSIFSGCTDLVSVVLPDNLSAVGATLCAGASSLTSVTIPVTVTTFELQCFSGCSSLTGISFPASVTTLGDYAFADCSSLTGVTFQGTTPPTFGTRIFGYNFNFPISVPCVSFDDYVEAFDDYEYFEKMVCFGAYKFPFWNYDDSTVPASGETREIMLSLTGISEYLEDLQIIESSITLTTDAMSGVTVSYRSDPYNPGYMGYADITFSPNTGPERTIVFTAQGDTSDGGTAVGTLTFTQTGTS